MAHIIIDSVPGGAEAALGAIRIVRDNVDARNLGHTVDGDMVIGNPATRLLGEEAAVTYDLSSAPNTVDNIAGILKRHTFLIELGALATNHIEEDTIAGFVALDMRIGGPVLGTEGPGVTVVGSVAPLGDTPVFSIEADEIESDFKGVGQQAGQFEHDGYARGTVVGGNDGRMVIGLVRIVISPRSTIPVGTDEDAVLELGLVAGYDVRALQDGTVVAFEIGLLHSDSETEFLEFRGNPLGTVFMSLTVHRAGAEVALGLTVLQGTIGTESRPDGRRDNGLGGGLCP